MIPTSCYVKKFLTQKAEIKVWNLACLRPNCENLAVFISGFSHKYIVYPFSLFWIFGLMYMLYNIPEFKLSKFVHVYAHKHASLPSWQLKTWNYPV